MINLLPKERIKQIHAARQNNLLASYILATLITLGLAVAVHLAAYGLLKSAENSNIATSKENQERVKEYKKIQSSSEEYVSNLKTAKAIFSKKISYTDALNRIANTLPEGIIVQSINLDENSIGNPTSLSARAKSYEACLKLKDNFQKSDIAKDVRITSINDQSGTESINKDYPFAVTLDLTYTNNLVKVSEDEK